MNLAAQAVLLLSATALTTPAFPPPRLVPVTAQMVCAWGPIAGRADSSIIVTTPAGPFTARISGGTKLVGLDGKELSGSEALRIGLNVRVYYEVDNGARAKEVDVIVASANPTE
jgi:hypothetical protein